MGFSILSTSITYSKEFLRVFLRVFRMWRSSVRMRHSSVRVRRSSVRVRRSSAGNASASCKAGSISILGKAPRAYWRWGNREEPRLLSTDECIVWMWSKQTNHATKTLTFYFNACPYMHSNIQFCYSYCKIVFCLPRRNLYEQTLLTEHV